MKQPSSLADHDVVIVAATRTAMASLNGAFQQTSAVKLGSAAIAGLLQQGIPAEQVEAVFMGCVLPASLGQAPARQAALGAGLSDHSHCMTINKVCGSGMQSIISAHQSLSLGQHQLIVAGGMENMSRAPYMLDKARNGYRLGPDKILDHMFTDGLEDAYEGKLMGCYAEQTAEKYHFSRQDQDAFAIESLRRAQQAIENGVFKDEITTVEVMLKKEQVAIVEDENPGKIKSAKIGQLKPAFKKDGTVTAANASSISDGAAALMLTTAKKAKKKGLTPIAVIKAYACHAQQPQWFTCAPIGAIEKVLTAANWSKQDVDLFEINEAFAVVTMAAMKTLQLNPEQVNVYGGACALGHPLGASGARIVVTLLNALRHHQKQRGVAAVCIGGGEATALAVELL